jgi:hypothetical protein
MIAPGSPVYVMTSHALVRYCRAMEQGNVRSPAEPLEPRPYEIQILGELDGRWMEWFDAIEISVTRRLGRLPFTKLHCPEMDQAKLRGMLNKIWDMNLALCSVQPITRATAGHWVEQHDPPTETDDVTPTHTPLE